MQVDYVKYQPGVSIASGAPVRQGDAFFRFKSSKSKGWKTFGARGAATGAKVVMSNYKGLNLEPPYAL